MIGGLVTRLGAYGGILCHPSGISSARGLWTHGANYVAAARHDLLDFDAVLARSTPNWLEWMKDVVQCRLDA